jgi:hypothetical protein
VTKSLDQTISKWNTQCGKLIGNIGCAFEPIHCMTYNQNNEELVVGTPTNKVGVCYSLDRNSVIQFQKLRPDLLKGSLSLLGILPNNNELLIGQDNGMISLIC